MSTLIAAQYVAGNPWLPILRRRGVSASCGYGSWVLVAMNSVVMPMSTVGHVAHLAPVKALGNSTGDDLVRSGDQLFSRAIDSKVTARAGTRALSC